MFHVKPFSPAPLTILRPRRDVSRETFMRKGLLSIQQSASDLTTDY